MSLPHLRINAPNTWVIPYSDQITFELRYLHDQKSMLLYWWYYSGWGMEHVAFARTGSQYLIYGCLQPITTWITHDAKPKLIDAELTLIVTMGQWPCHCLFCL